MLQTELVAIISAGAQFEGDLGEILSLEAEIKFLCFYLVSTSLTKMKRLLQGCSSVAATMQQSNVYATTGGDKVAN